MPQTPSTTTKGLAPLPVRVPASAFNHTGRVAAIPMRAASNSSAGSYVRVSGVPLYVHAQVASVPETRVDRWSALAYVAALITVIGLVFGISFPRSGVGVLVPAGLTAMWLIGVFSRRAQGRG
jgi:hypothetical protein